MNREIRLVIFDAGFVLIRIHTHWTDAAGAAGFTFNAEHDARLASQGDAVSTLSHQFETGQIDENAFVQRFAKLGGLELALVQAVLDGWIIEPYPGMRELLGEVKATGRQIACLSNTNINHWRQMTDPVHPKYIGSAEMDFTFASHELQCRKPEPAIYEYVEQATGILAQHILFFDDLEDNLVAARRRGWQTFLVRRDMPPEPQVREYLRQVGVLAI